MPTCLLTGRQMGGHRVRPTSLWRRGAEELGVLFYRMIGKQLQLPEKRQGQKAQINITQFSEKKKSFLSSPYLSFLLIMPNPPRFLLSFPLHLYPPFLFSCLTLFVLQFLACSFIVCFQFLFIYLFFYLHWHFQSSDFGHKLHRLCYSCCCANLPSAGNKAWPKPAHQRVIVHIVPTPRPVPLLIISKGPQLLFFLIKLT